jgi:pimeloyl-ACP methyl ester carboxylesterase
VRLSVAEAGDPSGEPVVLLHGFPEHSHSWRFQLPALAEAGYHAVAPDLRGYGGSDRPTAVEAYAAPALVGDVAGLIRALGHERAHVVGHDWGGGLAWGLAGNLPEVVRSLTILNAPQGPVSARLRREDAGQRAKSWYMLLFQFPGVAEAWLSDDDFANLRGFVFDTAAPGTFPPEITVPTRIIWGEADAYMSPPLLERSAATVTGPLRVERLPGVSHWVQQEVPDRVNELLLDFLRDR